MTIFDLEMMSRWRELNPPTEHLVSMIAQWTGVYKPSENKARQKAVEEIDPKTLYDPRGAIREALAAQGSMFKKEADVGLASHILGGSVPTPVGSPGG